MQPNSVDCSIRFRGVRRRYKCAGVFDSGRYLLAIVLLCRQHIDILCAAVRHTGRPVYRYRKASDEQSRHHVTWQPQQCTQVSKASDLYAGRGGAQFLHMSVAISCANAMDHCRAIGNDNVTWH